MRPIKPEPKPHRHKAAPGEGLPWNTTPAHYEAAAAALPADDATGR
jgi:hypothetical protein